MCAWCRFSAACLAGLLAVAVGTAAQPRPDAGRQASAAQAASDAPADRASVDAWLTQADALVAARQGLRARPLFERALAGARVLGLGAQELHARLSLGDVLYYATQYSAAREHGAAALAIAERLGARAGVAKASQLLGAVEDMSGNRREARTHVERAVAEFDAEGDVRGRAESTLQLLRLVRFDPAEELRLNSRVVEDARAVGDLGLEGRALHSLGDHLFTAGRYDEAFEQLTRAAAVLERLPDGLALGTVYNSLGRVYRAHGRLQEALAFQRRALAVHERVPTSFEHLQSLNAVATVLQLLGNLPEARVYYERALTQAERSSSPRVKDFVRANLAALLLEQGQFAGSATVLEEVIANGVDVFPGRRYARLSAAYLGLARPADALRTAAKAVDLCAKDEETCVEALGRRASAQLALGSSEAAIADVNAALDALEVVRARLVPTDFFKQNFHRSQEGLYSLAIGLQVRSQQGRAALETAELARSRAFLDLLASRDVRLKEKDAAQLASLRESVERPADRVDLAPAETPRTLILALRGSNRAPASVPPTAPAAMPSATSTLELQSFVSASPAAAADLVAAAARLQSTLVAYWVGDDEIFIWVVTPSGDVQVKRVGVLRSRLLALIRSTSPFVDTAPTAASSGSLRAAKSASRLVTRGAADVALQASRPGAWRELYKLLVDPVRSLLPRANGALLTIVPQGPLLNVSFAALKDARGRYLLEDYTLHYAPAGALLQFTALKRRPDARAGSMLLVADPALPKLSALDRPLPRLPGARSEASAIARLYPASRLTVLQDTGATEAVTRASFADRAVLHFATHAVVSDDDPFGSFLALGPTGGGTSGDGLLTAQEIYALDLRTDLVVLSACRSAGGQVNGDGISAFARAFIYAGTASLVASLWDVADEPTNRLLPAFYRAWLAGESKALALRGAQLRLLQDLRAGRVRIDTPAGLVSLPEHPAFWAGFALFGEAD